MVGAALGSTTAEPRLSRRQQEERQAAEAEQRWLDGLFYQSMIINHKASLFGHAHVRMLRALYSSQSQQQHEQQLQTPADIGDEELWGRVDAFLADAGGLMALRVQLLSARSAQPWMAPWQQGVSSSASAASSSAQGGDTGLGWRLAGRCLRDQHEHDYRRFRRRCLKHRPLLAAIDGEVGRLAAALASLGQEQQQQQQQQQPPAAAQPSPSSSSSCIAAPPALAQQLAAVDSAVLLESRLALWRRLRQAVLAVVKLGPGENAATMPGVDEVEGEEEGRMA